MKPGDLIAVNGNLYEYGGYYEGTKLHKVYDITVDEDGILTAICTYWYMSEEEMTEGFNKINFTEDQWYGIVAHFIREGNYHLNEEEITEATEDIVGRCFVMNMPQFHELEDYIACYMNR